MQILFFWVGLAFVAIGVLVVLSEARARRGAVAVPGRVVGFSRQKSGSNESYHTVAEFLGLDGQRRLIESAVGSNVLMNRAGETVSVLVRPDEPESAILKTSATYIIGIVLALLGTTSCWVFFATFRSGLFTIVASIAVTAFGVYKLHDFLDGRPVSMRALRELEKKALRGRVLPAASRDQILWADAAGVEAANRRQQRVNRFAWPLLVLAGAGLLYLAQHLQKTTDAFLAQAVRAPGRVVELATNDSSDGFTYAPVVEFEGHGERHRFKDSVSSNPPSYRTGDAVEVLYDPLDPGRARIDRGIWNRAVPLLVGAMGTLFALCGLWILLRRGRQAPEIAS